MHSVTISDFKSQFETLLHTKAMTLMRDFNFITLASEQKPWFDTGIDLKEGDCLTSFAAGQTQFKELPITLEASFQIWFRIGLQGEIFRGTRNSHSFTAAQAGRLYLASYFPGEWATKTGDLITADAVYEMVTGGFTVLLLRWQDNALESLTQLQKYGDVAGLIACEIDRLQAPVLPPKEWTYLWLTGPAEIYQLSKTPEKSKAVCCHTHNDVGLLQKSVILPFMPNTRLRWAWKVDELPSAVREDTLPTHDYLSIAVEFDNGQDITYYWSAELAPETAYRCPIPTWQHRETHLVIRSGLDGLGAWFNEERDVYADYATAIGGEMPKHIVKVWFIAVSVFQHQQGRCEYADISFLSNNQVIPVLGGEQSY
jgi:hypothetical protein